MNTINDYLNNEYNFFKKRFTNSTLTAAKKNRVRLLRDIIANNINDDDNDIYNNNNLSPDYAIEKVKECSNFLIDLEKQYGAKGHGRSEKMLQRCLHLLAPFRSKRLIIRNVRKAALIKKINDFIKSQTRFSRKNKLNAKLSVLSWLSARLSAGNGDSNLSYVVIIKLLKQANDDLKLIYQYESAKYQDLTYIKSSIKQRKSRARITNHIEQKKNLSITKEVALLRSLAQQVAPFLTYSDLSNHEDFLIDLKYETAKSIFSLYKNLPLNEIKTELLRRDRLQKLTFFMFLKYGSPEQINLIQNKINVNYDRANDRLMGPLESFDDIKLPVQAQTEREADLEEDTDDNLFGDPIDNNYGFELEIDMQRIHDYEPNCRTSVQVYEKHIMVIQKAKILALYNIEDHIQNNDRQLQHEAFWDANIRKLVLTKNIINSKYKYKRLYRLTRILYDPAKDEPSSPVMENMIHEIIFRLSDINSEGTGINMALFNSVFEMLDKIRIEWMTDMLSILSEIINSMSSDTMQFAGNAYARTAHYIGKLQIMCRNIHVTTEDMRPEDRVRLNRRLSQENNYNNNNYFTGNMLFAFRRTLQILGWNSDLVTVMLEAKLKNNTLSRVEFLMYKFFLMSNNTAWDNCDLLSFGAASKAYDATVATGRILYNTGAAVSSGACYIASGTASAATATATMAYDTTLAAGNMAYNVASGTASAVTSTATAASDMAYNVASGTASAVTSTATMAYDTTVAAGNMVYNTASSTASAVTSTANAAGNMAYNAASGTVSAVTSTTYALGSGAYNVGSQMMESTDYFRKALVGYFYPPKALDKE